MKALRQIKTSDDYTDVKGMIIPKGTVLFVIDAMPTRTSSI